MTAQLAPPNRWPIVLYPLARILAEYAPGSTAQPWTWDDEELDILARECCCRSHQCESPSIGAAGHYQLKLEAHIRRHGVPGLVELGADGRVWDGNHRVVAARRLGISALRSLSRVPATARAQRGQPSDRHPSE